MVGQSGKGVTSGMGATAILLSCFFLPALLPRDFLFLSFLRISFVKRDVLLCIPFDFNLAKDEIEGVHATQVLFMFFRVSISYCVGVLRIDTLLLLL